MPSGARFAVLCLTMALLQPFIAVSAPSSPAPYTNPNLAQSHYPLIHNRGGLSLLRGPTFPSRSLRKDEVIYKAVGPLNAVVPLYSAPYPDGKSVIWIGGYDRIAKLDAKTLDIITTHGLGGNTYYGEEEIERHVAAIDSLSGQGLIDYVGKLWKAPFFRVDTAYRVLSRDNELIMPFRGLDGSVSLRIYGDAYPRQSDSEIVLKREWKLPSEISRSVIAGTNLTSDGTIIVVTQDGIVIALKTDFSSYATIRLPRNKAENPGQDFFAAFVRNGVVMDERGGIYVLTRDNMHRIQWNGSRLSLDETDGAWSVRYPNDTGRGGGGTPALMGWGDKEDRLVIIADGNAKTGAIAFWRDKIPANWKAIPGFDRRVAGYLPIRFDVSKNEKIRIENSPIIMGYGAFFNNNHPVMTLPDQGSPTRQWLAEAYFIQQQDFEARGGMKVRWDPKDRRLKSAWTSQLNLASSVCAISAPSRMVYCWGARGGDWTVEGIDWDTGVSAAHYTIGPSQRYNPLGAPIIVSPDGSIDCGCMGGLGFTRVSVSDAVKQDKAN